MNHNLQDWLTEAEQWGPSGQPPMDGAGMPGMPDAGMGMPPQMPTNDPQMQGQMDGPQDQNSQDQGSEEGEEYPNFHDDPQAPDMPAHTNDEDQDFEQWKDAFFKESVKGDVNNMLDMIHQVRDLDLESYPRKFVEDNLQILLLRQNANIDKASKEIRRLIREELDQNNPSVSVVNHIFNSLSAMPELNKVFIKIKGTLGMKGDLHRKYVSSLLGAVQVGSGAATEDTIYNDKDFSIRISTRFNDKWGKIDIGKWSLKEDDPNRYLTEPETKRLEEGSPEEKEVLRRRIIVESIAEQFKTRALIANVVGTDGTNYMLGWDLATSLKSAYTDGKLVVRTSMSENSDAFITDDGEIVPYVDMKIRYVRDTGEVDEEGKPEKEEHDFLERIDGMLFLTAQFNILKEASSSFQGIVLKETPYTGNPSDLQVIMRCVPSSFEILMRAC